MMADGAFENPTVDAVFGLHVDPEFKTGEVGLCYGETMASSDRLIIHIKGKSSHGAYPHRGVDAIVIACHAILAIQTMMSREKDTFHPAIMSFGIIEGGKQPNVLCEDVLIRGICRTLNPETREHLMVRLDQILDGVTKTFGGSYDFRRESSHISVVNNNEMVDLVERAGEEVLGTNSVKFLSRPRLIVEDFGYYLQKKPGAFWFLGIGNPDLDTERALHNSSFDIDEAALAIGVAMHTTIVFDYLKKKEVRRI